MAYTRKQIVTCISIVYLIFVTALSAYASSRANRLSIPISDILAGLTTALPVVAGLLLEVGYDFSRRQERRRGLPKGETPRPPLVIIANTLIFIYSTAVITLLGTHVGPTSELNCGLDVRWRSLFRHKDSESVRAIQDAFKCCGYVNSHDQAWPFPDKSHDQHACEKAFGRSNGCLGPWKREEQRLAGMLMAVVGLVFIWQLAILATPTRRESWLHRVLPNQVSRLIVDEETGSQNRPRRAIDYLPHFGASYRDNVAEETSEGDETPIAPRAIDTGVQQIANGLPGAISEQEHEHTHGENEWART